MAKWEFYDEDDEIDLTESDSEPSFSFYDFKKWLTGQKKQPFEESLRETAANGGINQTSKEELKKLFKKRVRDKVQKKIDDKLAERKNNS